MSVACVVVTRDRRELLHVCLQAIASQTHRVDHVVVLDNASSDGTEEMVRREHPHVQLLRFEENVGGAGGFHHGMAAAHRTGADWIWTVDDDTIARPDTLERLLDATRLDLPKPSLLASRVDWTDGNPHPMNRPMLLRRDVDGLAAAARQGVLRLRATTFVSMLVTAEAIDRHGLPDADFFFQADDIDFTARILRHEPGYYVPLSIVEHRTKAAHDATHDPVRFYHHLRNTLFMLRGDAWRPGEKVALSWVVLESSVRFLAREGVSRASLATIARALRDGLRAR